MAFDAKPTNCFANWAANETTVTLPIASVPEMTSAEANATTGDIRKVWYALCERAWAWWNALTTADKSAKFTLTKSSSVNVSTGIVTNVYTFTFLNTISAQDVANEA